MEAALLRKSYPGELWFVGELVGETFSPKVCHYCSPSFHEFVAGKIRFIFGRWRLLCGDSAVPLENPAHVQTCLVFVPLLDILGALLFRDLEGSLESFNVFRGILAVDKPGKSRRRTAIIYNLWRLFARWRGLVCPCCRGCCRGRNVAEDALCK